MNNTKKSLDILEEQMFNILKEYVPQTGRGFSDGAEYVGMNTKGPYEEIEEDKPWYKKKYKEDSKNLKILIGHGSKSQKHAKKGSPFTEDPPKRRPVNKLSSPMALQEDAPKMTDTEAFLFGIQNGKSGDELRFKVLKRMDLTPAGSFCKGQEYSAKFINDNQAELFASFVTLGDNCDNPTNREKAEKSKKQIIEKFKQVIGNSDICTILDCNNSFFNGKQLKQVFEEIRKSLKQPGPTVEPKKETPKESPEEEQKKKETQQNLEITNSVTGKVADGVRADKAIVQTLGYHPVTKAFAKKFYETASEAISKIENPDDKKAAALIAALMGEISLIPVELVANIVTYPEPETYASVLDFMSSAKDSIFASLMGPIQELRETWKKVKEAVEKGGQVIKDLTSDYSLKNLPLADPDRNMIVTIGDNQKDSLKAAFEPFFVSKKFKFVQDFNITKETPPANITSDSEITKFIKDNKDKIGMFFISLGSTNKITISAESTELVRFLKNEVPKARIIWVGSPPNKISSMVDPKKLTNIEISLSNGAIGATSQLPFIRFTFINPSIDSTDAKNYSSDSETLSVEGAKKILEKELGTDKKDEKKDDKKDEKKDGPISVEPLDYANYNNYLKGINPIEFAKFNVDFSGQLIKLSKRAKQVYGEKTKIHIQSADRADDPIGNHSSGNAADIRIFNGSNNLSAQETYAFIIKAIVAGHIKDGGVGYYANDRGVYNADSMDVTTEYPHYDIDRGLRKWFWFKCEGGDISKCPPGTVPRTEKKEEKDAAGNKIIDPTTGKPKIIRVPIPGQFQTVVSTARQVINSSNPLKLPKDVLKFLNVTGRSDTPPAVIPRRVSGPTNENVKLIKKKFEEADLPENLTHAAIVNSWFESGWKAKIPGDLAQDLARPTRSGRVNQCAKKVLENEGPDAFCGGGLFGIHSCDGRGGCRATDRTAMSLDDIKDPEKSIDRIISDIKSNRLTGNILRKAVAGDTVEELVYAFCYDVERAGNRSVRCADRQKETNKILKKAGLV